MPRQKLNYMTRILGEHGNFNRISFGDSLWTSIIRPSIGTIHAAFYGSLLQFQVLKTLKVCSTKLEKLFWKRKWAFQNLLSYQNLGGNQLTNFLTDSVLIILQDLMNFWLTGYAKLYTWIWKIPNVWNGSTGTCFYQWGIDYQCIIKEGSRLGNIFLRFKHNLYHVLRDFVRFYIY